MYGEDSFFSLSPGGRAGLLLLSAIMAVALCAVVARVFRGRPIWLCLGGAVLAYGIFVWVSPQVYYAYYRLIFEGLPAQWVIGVPPFGDMLSRAVFAGRATLSAHGQGALFWVLVLIAIRASGQRGHQR